MTSPAVAVQHTFKVNVVEARRLVNEGSFIKNPKYDSTLKTGTNSIEYFWHGKYMIHWPSNIHTPIEQQFAIVTEL